jgi:HprK-related kinase B
MNSAMDIHLDSLADVLRHNQPLCDDELNLQLGACSLRLRSNSDELISRLRNYFGHVVSGADTPDLDLIAIEREPPELGVAFVDWAREPGKTGRKDAYFDLPGGRLIRKVRTGMLFLQSESHRIAAGPCLQYDNQVINFINAQYMNWLQHRGWMICHASGLVYRDCCLGIAGFSGGGKSTLMLHLMEKEDVFYLTNDRLFVRQKAGEAQAVGIPKLPRINPGTIVHNRRLHGLIPEQERQALLQLPPQELWEIEDKYDVLLEQVYGPGKIRPSAPLSAFLVLNWQRDSDHPLEVAPVELSGRRDLLAAIMKSPGPFYQYPDGSFYTDTTPFDEPAYLQALGGVKAYEARGRVDFEGLIDHCLHGIMG